MPEAVVSVKNSDRLAALRELLDPEVAQKVGGDVLKMLEDKNLTVGAAISKLEGMDNQWAKVMAIDLKEAAYREKDSTGKIVTDHPLMSGTNNIVNPVIRNDLNIMASRFTENAEMKSALEARSNEVRKAYNDSQVTYKTETGETVTLAKDYALSHIERTKFDLNAMIDRSKYSKDYHKETPGLSPKINEESAKINQMADANKDYLAQLSNTEIPLGDRLTLSQKVSSDLAGYSRDPAIKNPSTGFNGVSVFINHMQSDLRTNLQDAPKSSKAPEPAKPTPTPETGSGGTLEDGKPEMTLPRAAEPAAKPPVAKPVMPEAEPAKPLKPEAPKPVRKVETMAAVTAAVAVSAKIVNEAAKPVKVETGDAAAKDGVTKKEFETPKAKEEPEIIRRASPAEDKEAPAAKAQGPNGMIAIIIMIVSALLGPEVGKQFQALMNPQGAAKTPKADETAEPAKTSEPSKPVVAVAAPAPEITAKPAVPEAPVARAEPEAVAKPSPAAQDSLSQYLAANPSLKLDAKTPAEFDKQVEAVNAKMELDIKAQKDQKSGWKFVDNSAFDTRVAEINEAKQQLQSFSKASKNAEAKLFTVGEYQQMELQTDPRLADLKAYAEAKKIPLDPAADDKAFAQQSEVLRGYVKSDNLTGKNTNSTQAAVMQLEMLTAERAALKDATATGTFIADQQRRSIAEFQSAELKTDAGKTALNTFLETNGLKVDASNTQEFQAQADAAYKRMDEKGYISGYDERKQLGQLIEERNNLNTVSRQAIASMSVTPDTAPTAGANVKMFVKVNGNRQAVVMATDDKGNTTARYAEGDNAGKSVEARKTVTVETTLGDIAGAGSPPKVTVEKYAMVDMKGAMPVATMTQTTTTEKSAGRS